jgi:3',5'-cyclic AMP phosphodiesterase CpdA
VDANVRKSYQDGITPHGISRRAVLSAGVGALGSKLLAEATSGVVTFGIIADIHDSLSVMTTGDGQRRLEAFLTEVERRSPDFIIQLGDHCHAYPPVLNDEQRAFVRMWLSDKRPKYSVLGNHELDKNTKERIMGLLEMPRNFYSFDVKGVHFVVLDCMYLLRDGKYVDYENGNYWSLPEPKLYWVNSEQLEWLKADLGKSQKPTVVFSHPCLASYWAKGLEATRDNVRSAILEANREAGWQKVIATFSGHEHVDYHSQEEGVNFLDINSASYCYLGAHYGTISKYRDPLFAFVTLNPAGSVRIEGKGSVFVPPTPADAGDPDAKFLTASISSLVIPFVARHDIGKG